MERHFLRTIASAFTAVAIGTVGLPVYAATKDIRDRLKAIGGAAGFNTDTGTTTLATYIGRIISAATALLGVIFVAQIVYAGWLWMTGRDEAEQIEKAKHIIRRSIVGLAIVLGAWAITRFVLLNLYAAAG